MKQELANVEETEAFTGVEEWVVLVLLRLGPLSTVELRNIGGSILPRGMPGHYVLAKLEDMGLIQGRLPNRDSPFRIYSIVENEDDD